MRVAVGRHGCGQCKCWSGLGDENLKRPTIVVPGGRKGKKKKPWELSHVPLCFQFFDGTHEEARYQIPGPYNWKGKRRKDIYLTKGMRYHGESRDLP